MFGGATTTRGQGSYLSPKNKLINEKVGVVTSFTSRSQFYKQKPRIESLARRERKSYGQYSIGLEEMTPRRRTLFFVDK